MAQHDYTIANQGFPAFRSDLNNALAAIVSNNSGATEPTTMFAHQMWVDTAADPSVLKIRNADNDAWITIGSIDQTGDTFTLVNLRTSGPVVFNDAGADVDFRVEGDTDANLLFVDASTDRVGIGTSSPSDKLEITGGKIIVNKGDFSGGGTGAVIVRGTTTSAKIIELGLNETSDYGVINVLQSGVGGLPLAINTNGGNVGIGTSSPGLFGVSSGKLLDVVSSSGYAYVQLQGSSGNGGAIDFGDSSVRHAEIASLGGSALAFYTNGTNSGNGITERMRIASGGQVNINEPAFSTGRVNIKFNPLAEVGFVINGTETSGTYDYVRFLDGSFDDCGSIDVNATANTTAYTTSSDYRLKENVAPIVGALSVVSQLNPVTWNWKHAPEITGQGFIAHELQQICPDAVTGEKDETEIQQVEVSPAVPATYDEEGNELTPAVEAVYEEREVPKYQGVDTSFLVATLTAAIQELKAELDEAKARIAALENA